MKPTTIQLTYRGRGVFVTQQRVLPLSTGQVVRASSKPLIVSAIRKRRPTAAPPAARQADNPVARTAGMFRVPKRVADAIIAGDETEFFAS